jgi:hypothetical protein
MTTGPASADRPSSWPSSCGIPTCGQGRWPWARTPPHQVTRHSDYAQTRPGMGCRVLCLPAILGAPRAKPRDESDRCRGIRNRVRARHVPVKRVAYGDSRSFTEQPAMVLTCAATGRAGAATTFASRGPGVRVPLAPPEVAGQSDVDLYEDRLGAIAGSHWGAALSGSGPGLGRLRPGSSR